jgi:hypothetical protein
MALLTGYQGQEGYVGLNNKVQDELPKEVRLFISATTLAGGDILVTYNTTQTERYRYVGMTAEAAATCQTDMIALYTEEVNGVMQCVADVSATRQDGHMWQVSVSVCRVLVTGNLIPAPE